MLVVSFSRIARKQWLELREWEQRSLNWSGVSHSLLVSYRVHEIASAES